MVLDLKKLALKMRDDGISPVNLFYLFFPKFKGAINNIPIQTIKIVSEDELKFQYRLFLERLFDLTKETSLEKLKIMDNKDLILKFFDPDNRPTLFKNVEAIMQAMAVCAVKHSCESILESYVSRGMKITLMVEETLMRCQLMKNLKLQ